ncbi:hypothetical protein [Acuticoccus yangtzensis]|uniref:hypothetical protein n=1 Tax=Acuticoccus yangtzensis TaxID=1443441 RepID=UPI0013006C40|nr:hypothetical protein [Acuticoccus yangtzensis]
METTDSQPEQSFETPKADNNNMKRQAEPKGPPAPQPPVPAGGHVRPLGEPS